MKKHTVPFQRKLKGKTDYRKRLLILESGRPRIAIRKSVKNMLIQGIEYQPTGDKVIFTAHTNELKKLGWKASLGNIPSAYLLGLLAAKKAKAKGIGDAVIDLGMQTNMKGGRLFAAVKGLIDAGLKVPASEEAFPSKDRISGKHITDYASKSGKKSELNFEETKAKIMGK